jgi:hypothetical protein
MNVIGLPRNLNMFICNGDFAIGLSKKQSRFVPASSLPFGVGMSNGREPFCNSSHISVMLSL